MADEKKLTVDELAATAVPMNIGITFDEYDKRVTSPYAVEGNDLTGYTGVSPEYRTYSSVADAPLVPDSDKPKGRHSARKRTAAPAMGTATK